MSLSRTARFSLAMIVSVVAGTVVVVTLFGGTRVRGGESPPMPGSGVQRIGEAFPPPEGAQRAPRGAFGEWLGNLEVVDPSVPVRTFDGSEVGHNARVVALDMVPGDLQQCADTAIRLRAEWLKSTGGEIAFHATSGDLLSWSRWEQGERPVESGGRIRWRRGSGGGWNDYLAKVFTWAGTRSLALDTTPASEPRAGDLIVVPGSPGHAVVLLDVAKRGDEILVLLGEGYMPAQNFHVEIGPERGWWRYDETIDLGHVAMPTSGLRRWR